MCVHVFLLLHVQAEEETKDANAAEEAERLAIEEEMQRAALEAHISPSPSSTSSTLTSPRKHQSELKEASVVLDFLALLCDGSVFAPFSLIVFLFAVLIEHARLWKLY